jgi:hypothetical protein
MKGKIVGSGQAVEEYGKTPMQILSALRRELSWTHSTARLIIEGIFRIAHIENGEKVEE